MSEQSMHVYVCWSVCSHDQPNTKYNLQNINILPFLPVDSKYCTRYFCVVSTAWLLFTLQNQERKTSELNMNLSIFMAIKLRHTLRQIHSYQLRVKTIHSWRNRKSCEKKQRIKHYVINPNADIKIYNICDKCIAWHYSIIKIEILSMTGQGQIT